VYTIYRKGLLKKIEDKSNIILASGKKPTEVPEYLITSLFFNAQKRNELTAGISINNPYAKKITNKEFLEECIRIAPKKGQ
jgi:hypothetical protein